MNVDSDHPFAAPGPEAVYRVHLAQGRFAIQRCGACAAHAFPPRALCPHCGEPALGWVDASGDGTVYAVTVVARRAEQGGDYNVVLVDLAEGARMMSRVEGLPPGKITIGLAVRARIAPHEDGHIILFDAAGGAP